MIGRFVAMVLPECEVIKVIASIDEDIIILYTISESELRNFKSKDYTKEHTYYAVVYGE